MDINEVEPITIAPINELNNDSGFEPQARLRANTWPVRPREFATPGEETNSSTPPISDTSENALEYANVSKDSSTNSTVGKKGGTRRNAWGSLSYADLITKAIESSTEKRLTLSQIYDWMVQNVPYFKDKGDNNSSAGWKNSIRHNLSLHNRFMRVQNEGTGKSSWWVLNPDAKPGKTPRRRAASMDPKEMAKKRGRAKKRVEQLRTGDFENYRQNSNPGSEFSSTSDLSSISGDPFALSPHDIRARTGSNASSFGRLSPIQAGVEPEIDDGFGSSWGECLSNGKEYVVPDRHITSGAESVSEHLAELFMGDSLSMPEKTQPSNIVGNHTSMNCSIGMMEQSGFLPNPPAYSSHPIGLQQHRGTYGTVRNDGLGAISSVSMLPPMPSRELYKNSEPFVSSPGYPKTTMSGMSLRDLLSDISSDVTQHHGQDFTVDVKFLQECAIPPNRNLPSPKEITRTPPSNAFMPSIRISPQHQQPMMVGGITNAIMQQQQQQQQCSPNSPPQQQQYNAQIYRNLQQRMSSENLLQAVQMKGMQAQMLRCSPTIKQEPLSFPASPIVAKSEPVSPVSCMPASPTNRVSGCRLSANDLTRHYSYIKQENQLVGGNYGTSDSFSTYPPPLPMDLDFSLQELRAGGLECDVDSILQEGNFDLDFHSGMSGISGDMPFS